MADQSVINMSSKIDAKVGIEQKCVPRMSRCERDSQAGGPEGGVRGEVNLPLGGRRFGRKKEKKKESKIERKI